MDSFEKLTNWLEASGQLTNMGRLRKLVHRGGLGLLSIGIFGVVLTGNAWAAELKVTDSQGSTLSVSELPSGATAVVEVALKEAQASAVNISLVDVTSGKSLSSVASKETASFSGVAAGVYRIEISPASAEIRDVSIRQTAKQVSKNTEEDNSNRQRALFVGGASAVAGVLGVALSNSSGSSSSGNSSVSLLDQDGAGIGAGSAGSSGTSPRANAPIISNDAGFPGQPSVEQAGTTVTDGGTPPGAPSNDGGVGSGQGASTVVGGDRGVESTTPPAAQNPPPSSP